MSDLSPRELEVLNLIAAGRTNRAIAQELGTALGTVKAQAQSICWKLGAANRTDAVMRGVARGLVALPSLPPWRATAAILVDEVSS